MLLLCHTMPCYIHSTVIMPKKPIRSISLSFIDSILRIQTRERMVRGDKLEFDGEVSDCNCEVMAKDGWKPSRKCVCVCVSTSFSVYLSLSRSYPSLFYPFLFILYILGGLIYSVVALCCPSSLAYLVIVCLCVCVHVHRTLHNRRVNEVTHTAYTATFFYVQFNQLYILYFVCVYIVLFIHKW